MPERLAQVETIVEDYRQYASLNPAFQPETTDRRARRQVDHIFYADLDTREENSEREVQRRIEIFQIAIRAKIAQLTGNLIWQQHGGSTDETFRASPRTFLKTVQEVLTDSTERMIFERTDELLDPANAQKAIKSIIIDPRRISDSLLKNLGLDEYIPAKGSKKAAKLSRRAEAIPEIRQMLAALEPIRPTGREHDQRGLHYFRLMRITQGKNTGHVIGTQNIEGEKVLFKTDLYGAERRLAHIEDGYTEEIRKLKWIEMTLRRIHERLDDWQDVRFSEELAALKQGMMECVNSLEFVRDDSKKELKKKIGQCVTLRDRQGRYNPSAIQAAMTKAFRYLGQRLQKIERIWRYVGGDKAKVLQLIEEQQAPLNQFLDEVETMHDRFRILRVAHPMAPPEKDRVIGNLRARYRDTQSLKFEPYLSFGEKSRAQIQRTAEALQDNRDQDAAKEFVKNYLLTKMARAYQELQDLYRKISLYPQHIHPETLLNDIHGINQKFASHSVAREVMTPEYNEAFGQIYHLLNSLRKRLRELLYEESTPAQTDAAAQPEKSPSVSTATVLDSIIEGIAARMPRLRGFLDHIKGLLPVSHRPQIQKPVAQVVATAKETPVKRPYTEEEKLQTYEKMKQRIREFDFAAVIKSLN